MFASVSLRAVSVRPPCLAPRQRWVRRGRGAGAPSALQRLRGEPPPSVGGTSEGDPEGAGFRDAAEREDGAAVETGNSAAKQLRRALDQLTADTLAIAAGNATPTVTTPDAVEPAEGRRSAAAAVESWREARALQNPAAGVIALQQEALRRQLSEDRRLEWQRGQQEVERRLAEARRPPAPAVVEADELPPATVEEIFDAVAADPSAELAAKRDARVREALAVQIEQFLTSGVFHARGFDGASSAGTRTGGRTFVGPGGRVLSAKAAATPNAGVLPIDAVVAAAPGQDERELEASLSELAPKISRALQDRWLVSVVPQLRFAVVPAEEAQLQAAAPGTSRAATLWHQRRRLRREGAHAAMRSWHADMSW